MHQLIEISVQILQMIVDNIFVFLPVTTSRSCLKRDQVVTFDSVLSSLFPNVSFTSHFPLAILFFKVANKGIFYCFLG